MPTLPLAMSRVSALLLTGAIALGCSSATDAAPPPPTHPAGLVDSVYPLAFRPYGAAVSKAGVVLLTRLDNQDVLRGSIASFVFLQGISVGNVPTDIAFTPNGSRAFVSNQADSKVGVIDVATATQTSTLALSASAFRVKVNPAGTKLYATTAGNTVHVFNASTLAPITTITVGGQTNGLAFDASGAKLYVSNQADATVQVIDASTDAVIGSPINVGSTPQDIAISPDGTELWVASEDLGVQVYSLPAGTLLTTLSGTVGAFGLAITPDGVQVYVALSTPGQFLIYTRITRAFVVGYFAGSPRRIAFDVNGAHAVVTDELAGAVLLK